MLESLLRIRTSSKQAIKLSIFGTRPDLTYWETSIQPALDKLRKGSVTASYEGEFQTEQLRSLMSLVDWVVVPSTWWENAPTVIFEAVAAGRPVLTGDVGGMREAVLATGCGRTCVTGSVGAWARLIEEVTHPSRVGEWDALYAACAVPWTNAQIVREHLRLYVR